MALGKQIKTVLGVGFACLFFCSCFKQAKNSNIEILQADLNAFIESPTYDQALWGLCVVDTETGDALINYNPKKFFTPASLTKAITAGMALDLLGADYSIQTGVYAKAYPNEEGKVESLYLYGHGDPLLEIYTKDGANSLETLAQQLKDKGVREVSGDIIADASFFHAYYWGKGWEWADRTYYYGTAFGALNVHQNTMSAVIEPPTSLHQSARVSVNPEGYYTASTSIKTVPSEQGNDISWANNMRNNHVSFYGTMGVGVDEKMQMTAGLNELKVGIRDSAEMTGSFFEKVLREKGIEVHGKVRIVTARNADSFKINYNNLVLLAEVSSPSLEEMTPMLLANSTYNAGAELLALQVGANEPNQYNKHGNRERTDHLASEAGKRFFNNLGLSDQPIYLVDGSGLSVQNKLTPYGVALFFKAMLERPVAEPFMNSLLTTNSSKYLQKRFNDDSLKDVLFFKNGGMTGISTTGGYIKASSGKIYAFAIMLNNFDATRKPINKTEAIDHVTKMIANVFKEQ